MALKGTEKLDSKLCINIGTIEENINQKLCKNRGNSPQRVPDDTSDKRTRMKCSQQHDGNEDSQCFEIHVDQDRLHDEQNNKVLRRSNTSSIDFSPEPVLEVTTSTPGTGINTEINAVSECNSFASFASTVATKHSNSFPPPLSNIVTRARSSNNDAMASTGIGTSCTSATSSLSCHERPAQSRSPAVASLSTSPILPVVYTPKTNNISRSTRARSGNNSSENCLRTKIDSTEVSHHSPAKFLVPVARSPHYQKSSSDANTSPLSYIPTQIIAEEIDKTDGWVFQDLDDFPKDYFLHATGVRSRAKIIKPKEKRKSKSNSEKISKSKKRRLGASSVQLSENTLSQPKSKESYQDTKTIQYYAARAMYAGVSVNLGSDYLSSAPAAASLDIANQLWYGSENNKPRYVLSESELSKCIQAINNADMGDGGKQGHFGSLNEKKNTDFMQRLFTGDQKDHFESLVDRALSSLGGKDDFYAGILCGLDPSGGSRKSKKTKSTTSAPQSVWLGSEEKYISNSNKGGVASLTTVHGKEKENELQRSATSSMKYVGGHVIFEIDDDGLFSWKTDQNVAMYETKGVQARSLALNQIK